MAGTAAGAAKATEVRKAKAAARRAVMGTAIEQPSSEESGSLAIVETVGAQSAAVPFSGQAVESLTPGAAVVVDSIIKGRVKASAAVRGNLAMRVLELAHKPGGGAQPAAPAGMVGALEALARAIGARIPRTVEGSASVETVKPE